MGNFAEEFKRLEKQSKVFQDFRKRLEKENAEHKERMEKEDLASRIFFRRLHFILGASFLIFVTWIVYSQDGPEHEVTKNVLYYGILGMGMGYVTGRIQNRRERNRRNTDA